jgi:hypothetical protein
MTMALSDRLGFINNIRVGGRVLIALSVPVLAFFIFAGEFLYENWHRSEEIHKVERLAHVAPELSHLVHELQKERGASAVYINTKGAKFSDILKEQKVSTDEKHSALSKELEHFDIASYGHEI